MIYVFRILYLKVMLLFTGGPTPLPLECSVKKMVGVIIHSSCLVALTSLESSAGSGSRLPPQHISGNVQSTKIPR